MPLLGVFVGETIFRVGNMFLIIGIIIIVISYPDAPNSCFGPSGPRGPSGWFGGGGLRLVAT